MSRILIIIILVCANFFLIGSLVTAQQKISTNSKKSPIEITAENGIEWHKNEKKYIASGNAIAKQGDLIEVSAKIVFTSNRTACAKVTAWAMSKSDWTKTEICQGYFFMIAIDSMMRPIPIPQFNPESDEQKADWDTAQAIREHMLSQRNK